MSSVTIILVGHDADFTDAWDQIVEQNPFPNEVILVYSGHCLSPAYASEEIEDKDRNDWGNHKCSLGLEKATSDYVCFWNHDSKYSENYLNKMLEATKGGKIDLVLCDFVDKSGKEREAAPRVNHTDRGNMLVRTELAQKVGYNHTHRTADGEFVEELVAAGASWTRVPEVLFNNV